MQGGAIISECGRYRYQLTRQWGSGPCCLFVMLNPSTADAAEDDPTIRRCVSFAKREGCGWLAVLNLFAFRATKPAGMRAAADPVGPRNNGYLEAARDLVDGPMIAAWGAHGSFMDRDQVVRAVFGNRLLCLNVTKGGQPGHPLYVPADTPLRPVPNCMP